MVAVNGPDHYREAERLVELASSPHVPAAKREVWAQRAQVHATLSLAAATAATRYSYSNPDGGTTFPAGWAEVVEP